MSTMGQNLLLGFKPVELYVESIEQRYGGVATVCADAQGGSLIGIKWRSAVSLMHSKSLKWVISQTPGLHVFQASSSAVGQL